MSPKDLLELMQAAGLPKDVVKYCVMPFVYPNTNKQRKQIMKHRKALMTSINFIHGTMFLYRNDTGEISYETLYAVSVKSAVKLANLNQYHSERSTPSHKFLKRIGAITNPNL